MTASLYTDAHGELQQKNKKTQIKGGFFWGNCTGVLTSSFLSRPLDLVHNSFPRPTPPHRTTIISELRGSKDVDVFQALPVPGRGARCSTPPMRTPSTARREQAPEFSREVARMIALILHINRQTYEQQTERLTTCFLYRRKEQM